MAFSEFIAQQPLVVPAQEEKVYDLYWLKSMVVSANRPDTPAKLHAEFVPYRKIKDAEGNVIGAEIKQPLSALDYKIIDIENLFATAAQNQQVANAMEAVFQALKELGNM